MYQDPKNIRKHVIKIRLSDRENELLNAMTNFSGGQKAALIRKLALERAEAVLFDDSSCAVSG